MPTILLHIQGIHTPDDEERLESALRAQDGVLGVVASRADGCAEVDVDDDIVTIAQLIDTAAEAGFDASLGG